MMTLCGVTWPINMVCHHLVTASHAGFGNFEELQAHFRLTITDV